MNEKEEKRGASSYYVMTGQNKCPLIITVVTFAYQLIQTSCTPHHAKLDHTTLNYTTHAHHCYCIIGNGLVCRSSIDY